MINKHAEAIIEKAIKDLYLTNQRISVQKVVLEVKRLCHEYHILDVPHANTVRNRIAAISQKKLFVKEDIKKRQIIDLLLLLENFHMRIIHLQWFRLTIPQWTLF